MLAVMLALRGAVSRAAVSRILAMLALLAPFCALAYQDSSPSPVSRAECISEIDVKLKRVHNFLLQQHLAGVLLTRSIISRGSPQELANNMIVITSETGAASLLIMGDGHEYVVGNNSEMPRPASRTRIWLDWAMSLNQPGVRRKRG